MGRPGIKASTSRPGSPTSLLFLLGMHLSLKMASGLLGGDAVGRYLSIFLAKHGITIHLGFHKPLNLLYVRLALLVLRLCRDKVWKGDHPSSGKSAWGCWGSTWKRQEARITIPPQRAHLTVQLPDRPSISWLRPFYLISCALRNNRGP